MSMSESEKVALIDRVVRELNERSTYHRTEPDTALMSLVYDDDIDAQITVREFVDLVLNHSV